MVLPGGNTGDVGILTPKTFTVKSVPVHPLIFSGILKLHPPSLSSHQPPPPRSNPWEVVG